jgi:hypothetical protein
MKSQIRQFAVYANAGHLVCIENKATPKSALRIAATIYGGGYVCEMVNDGSGTIQLRKVEA